MATYIYDNAGKRVVFDFRVVVGGVGEKLLVASVPLHRVEFVVLQFVVTTQLDGISGYLVWRDVDRHYFEGAGRGCRKEENCYGNTTKNAT